MAQYISYLDFKKAYDSVRRQVSHTILAEFGMSRKEVAAN
jgi:hypothetical protein